MPDLAVLSLPNNRRLYHSVFLFSFALFLIAGNFFRIIPIRFLPSSFSIVEFFFYFLSLPLYFSKIRKSQLLLLFITASTLYGFLLNGFSLISLLYSFKLMGMIAAGVVLGEVLSHKYGKNREQVVLFFVRIFSLVLLVGSVIFFAFPKSHLFFLFLHKHGINYFGDPHIRRFISPFFDPNYYSAIACIPLILIWHYRHLRSHYSFLFLLFSLSIFVSFSRSGIATTLILFFIVFCLHPKTLKLTLHKWMQLGCFILLLMGAACFFSKEWFFFWKRSIHLFHDPTALKRFSSFQTAAELFWEHPFLGMGYNQLLNYLSEHAHPFAIDSSILITLINFGLLPTCGFLVLGAIWMTRRIRRKDPLFRSLYIYLIICILFTSQFNNLLYYQFWLVPMIALFTYLDKGKREDSICS